MLRLLRFFAGRALLTPDARERMLGNGRQRQRLEAAGAGEPDYFPVVKLFTPDAGCVWLLAELDPDDPDIAYGLCDLGMGYPELSRVRISEIESIRGPLRLRVKLDTNFTPEKTIQKYAEEARICGHALGSVLG